MKSYVRHYRKLFGWRDPTWGRRWASVDLNYTEIQGDSESSPLIISHGMLGSSGNWASLAKAFNRTTRRRIINTDARNHGISPHTTSTSIKEMAEDNLKLLDKLQINKASLLGHSMGGMTAMALALMYPERVDSLIVVDVSPTDPRNKSETVDQMSLYFEGLEKVVIPQNKTLSEVRAELDNQLAQYIPHPSSRAWLLMNIYEKPDGNFAWKINVEVIKKGFFEDTIYFSREVKAKKSDIRTLFIGGSRSPYIPREDHENIKLIFVNSDIQYIDNAGHWVHSEKPVEFLDVAQKFLNSH